jgi:hypothetical protein
VDSDTRTFRPEWPLSDNRRSSQEETADGQGKHELTTGKIWRASGLEAEFNYVFAKEVRVCHRRLRPLPIGYGPSPLSATKAASSSRNIDHKVKSVAFA